MNKHIHVIFPKASIFTDMISFALQHSPRRKPRPGFKPDLIIGETQD